MARVFHVVREKVSYINTVGLVCAITHNTLTLSECADAKRIHMGMYLRAGVSHTQLRTGCLEVLETDEDNGVVRVADTSQVNGFCQGDLLFWVAER